MSEPINQSVTEVIVEQPRLHRKKNVYFFVSFYLEFSIPDFFNIIFMEFFKLLKTLMSTNKGLRFAKTFINCLFCPKGKKGLGWRQELELGPPSRP